MHLWRSGRREKGKEENVWISKLFFVNLRNSREEKDEIILRRKTFSRGEEEMKRRKIFGESEFFICGGAEEQRRVGQEENIFKKEK